MSETFIFLISLFSSEWSSKVDFMGGIFAGFMGAIGITGIAWIMGTVWVLRFLGGSTKVTLLFANLFVWLGTILLRWGR